MHRTALRLSAGDALLTELADTERAAEADGLATETDCPEPGAARSEGNRRLVLRYVLTGATLAALAVAAILTLAARGAGRTRPAETPVQRQTGLSGENASYTMLGSGTFCRNYKQILLMRAPGRQLSEQDCGMQCWHNREHCVGFAYKEDESCRTRLQDPASCILFQNECVPEPDTCWRTFRMTETSAPDLTNVPQNLPDGAPLQVPANFDGKSTCGASGVADLEIVPHGYAAAPTYTLDECTNLCYITSGCQGVRYTESDKSCLLLDEICAEVTGVTQELRLMFASDGNRVKHGVASALASLDIPNASVRVKVSERDTARRRLVPAELRAQRQLSSVPVWSVKWTFVAPGSNTSEQSAAAAKVCDAAESWVADAADFAWVIRQTLPGVDIESLTFEEPNKHVAPSALNLFELGWPTTPLTTSRRTGVGCNNWEVIGNNTETDVSRGSCALHCEATIGCVGFGYQSKKCDSVEGTCMLFGGECDEGTNECWDKYDKVTKPLVIEPKTTPQPETTTSSQRGSKEGTAVTVTTTKMLATDHLVFFNEILYRSDNPDIPGVEIAGPDGTDLSGYTVTVYSEAGDVVQTVELSGTIEAERQQENGVVWQGLSCQRFTAVALSFGDFELINFLSVLEPVTATAPPATGMTSTVIRDENDEPMQCAHDLQKSLQLHGTGISESAFKWKVSLPSPGQVNVLQTFGSVSR